MYCQVEPARENRFILPESPSQYADIDHVKTEKARKVILL